MQTKFYIQYYARDGEVSRVGSGTIIQAAFGGNLQGFGGLPEYGAILPAFGAVSESGLD